MTDKQVKLNLVGVDGNAFAIMAVFSRQAKKEGWTKQEIDEVLTEAQSGDYDHLLATISDRCDAGTSTFDDEDEDEEDYDFDDEDDEEDEDTDEQMPCIFDE